MDKRGALTQGNADNPLGSKDIAINKMFELAENGNEEVAIYLKENLNGIPEYSAYLARLGLLERIKLL